jgi:hypothetical protein
MKKIVLLTAVILGLASGSAQANVTAMLATGDGICQTLDGEWYGTGRFSSGFFDCSYAGRAIVTGNNPFTAQITLEKTSGGLFCINKHKVTLDGTCERNRLVVNSSDLQLRGIATENALSFNGQVIFPIEGDVVIGMSR